MSSTTNIQNPLNLRNFGMYPDFFFNTYHTYFIFIFDWLNWLDPFADAFRGDDTGTQDGLIHIRIQQRSGRKTLTTVQGIADNFDKKKIVKACKKVCCD